MEGRGDAYIRTSQGWEGGEPCGWGEKGRAREEDRHVPIILVILTQQCMQSHVEMVGESCGLPRLKCHVVLFSECCRIYVNRLQTCLG